MTDTQTETTSEQEVTTQEAPAPATPAKERTTITVATNVPRDMKQLIDKAAEDAGQTPAVWLRKLLADTVKYELPAEFKRGRKVSKYEGMSPEQKAKAQKDEQNKKRQIASALLAALDEGELNVNLDEILAKFKPKTRKTKDEGGDVETTTVEVSEAPTADTPASA